MATIYLRSDFSESKKLVELASSWDRSLTDTLGYVLSFAHVIAAPDINGCVHIDTTLRAWINANIGLFDAMIACGWIRLGSGGRLYLSFPDGATFEEPNNAPVMDMGRLLRSDAREVH